MLVASKAVPHRDGEARLVGVATTWHALVDTAVEVDSVDSACECELKGVASGGGVVGGSPEVRLPVAQTPGHRIAKATNPFTKWMPYGRFEYAPFPVVASRTMYVCAAFAGGHDWAARRHYLVFPGLKFRVCALHLRHSTACQEWLQCTYYAWVLTTPPSITRGFLSSLQPAAVVGRTWW